MCNATVTEIDAATPALDRLAVAFGLSVVLDASIGMHLRISAARMVLPFLMPKPAVRTVLKEWTGGGVAFLESLAASMDTQTT